MNKTAEAILLGLLKTCESESITKELIYLIKSMYFKDSLSTLLNSLGGKLIGTPDHEKLCKVCGISGGIPSAVLSEEETANWQLVSSCALTHFYVDLSVMLGDDAKVKNVITDYLKAKGVSTFYSPYIIDGSALSKLATNVLPSGGVSEDEDEDEDGWDLDDEDSDEDSGGSAEDLLKGTISWLDVNTLFTVALEKYLLIGNKGNYNVEAEVVKKPKVVEEKTEGVSGSLSRFLKHDYGCSKDVDEDFIYGGVVDLVVNNVFSVYTSMYANLYGQKPMGVLTSHGVLTYVREKQAVLLIKKNSVHTKNLFNTVNKELRGSFFEPKKAEGDLDVGYRVNICDDSLNLKGSLSANYCPLFQVMLLFGLTHLEGNLYHSENNWVKYAKDMRMRLTCILQEVLVDVPESEIIRKQGELIELLTCSIVVVEFDMQKAMNIRLKNDRVPDMSCVGKLLSTRGEGIFGLTGGLGSLLTNNVGGAGVHNLLYVFNEEAYDSEILFAHSAHEKRIQSGGKITSSELLLGRTLTGVNYTMNMDDEAIVSMAILAGSRSGKGVLTMNIVSSLIACGHPVFYLDFKPDMAPVFWDLERKGLGKFLSIDGNIGKDDSGNPNPRGISSVSGGIDLGFDIGNFGCLPYFKALQMAMVLAEFRAASESKDTPCRGSKKFVTICDEAQKAQSACTGLINKLDAVKTKLTKAKETGSEEYAYVCKLIDLLWSDLPELTSSVLRTTGGKGNSGFITIAQDSAVGEWSIPTNKNSENPALYQLVQKCRMKFIGAGAGNSSSYGLPTSGFLGAEYINSGKSKGSSEDKATTGRRGYFAVTSTAKVNVDNIKVIKTYLVLNENDYVEGSFSGYVGKMLGNIGAVNAEKLVAEVIAPDGVKDERVGFGGLLSYLANEGGADINGNFALGYAMAEYFMRATGLANKYSSVEEYLYDISPDAIIPSKELISGLLGGTLSEEGTEGGSEGGKGAEDTESDLNIFEDDSSGGSEPTGVFADEPDTVTTPPSSVSDCALNMPMDNQFRQNKGATADITPTQMMASMTEVSQMFMSCIQQNFGALSRITDLAISQSGVVVLNGYQFKPVPPEHLLNNLPVDIRGKIANRAWAELFNFKDLYKFRNLRTLDIENREFAEFKVAVEVGIPRGKWEKLFKKIATLEKLSIGGIDIVKNGSIFSEKDTDRGFNMKEKFKNVFGLPTVSVSSIGNMYSNKKIPTALKVAGTVAGVGGMFWLASFVGAWALPLGVLFGTRLRSDKK